MPVRLVCPSCSATLSVKDEYAGRAVKCPKCGGVIPASQPGAAPPPAAPSKPAMAPLPPPEPEPAPAADSPFGALDEPAKPKPKITGRPTSKTAAKADAENDEDVKPARRKGRDDDDRDRDRDDEKGAKKGSRDSKGADEEEGDDRPTRGKKKRDDGDGEGPRNGKKKGGGGVVIVAILCGTLLLCCGGVGYGGWWAYNKFVKLKNDVVEGVEKAKEDLEKWNPSVSQFNYEQLKVGTTTRAQAETSLGKGRLATSEDVQKIFPNDVAKTQQWTEKVVDGRAVLWRNGDDFLLVAFNPNAEGTSRVQMKEWRPKIGASASLGEPNNAKFETAYPVLSATTEVPAEEVAKDYRASSITADQRYKDKTFIINGKVKDIMMDSGKVKVTLDASPANKASLDVMHCTLRVGQTPFAYSRGQRIKVSGKCTGGGFGDVNFSDCSVLSGEKDPTSSITASFLVNSYANPASADTLYKDKNVTVTDAVVESVENGVVIATSTSKKATGKKIRVEFDSALKNQFANLRVGATVKIKGKCKGLDEGDILITDAWFAP